MQDSYMRGKRFALSPDQIEICRNADRSFRELLYPLQAKMDQEDWWPQDAYRKVADLGYLGLTVPSEYGGQGLDYLTAGLICERMTYWNPAFAFSWVNADNLVIDNIYRNGNEEQRRRFLPQLCQGRIMGALGMTEPGAGSDALGSMKTTARRDRDVYVLNGVKTFITNAPIADFVLAYVRTNISMGRSKGITALLVPRSSTGYRIGQHFDKMGFRGSPNGELVFEDCRVDVRNRLRDEDAGHIVMHSGLDLERLMSACLCLGVSQRALELSVEYAGVRQQFGKPIGKFQLIQSKLAEMYTAIESARALVYVGLDLCDAMNGTDSYGRGEIHKLAAAAYMQAASVNKFVTDEAVQIHGGSGYMRDTEVNRLLRTAKVMEIAAGSQEIRRVIIAKELLNA